MVLSVLSPRKSYCANDISNTQSAISIDENELESQEKTFGISSFIQNSKQYTGEFFEDIDISDILNSAIKGEIDNSNIYKKILSKLGNEVQNGVKSLACILAIIIILIGSITFLSKFVFATNDDKILINKKNKSILIVLSTSNESRSMAIKDFKEKTQATNIDKGILAQAIATFKNNEK